MKTLKSNISEAYKVQVDCFKDSKSDCYDKTDMKEKGSHLRGNVRKFYFHLKAFF